MTSSEITIGQLISYEDMANPRRVGVVVEAGIGWQNADFRIRWEDGSDSISDCRQHGWKPVAQRTEV